VSDVNDLASSLFGTRRAEVAGGLTSTVYGTATSDSSGGSVSVRMGADTLRADGQAGTSVLVPTTTDVRAGETVIVTVVDGHPVVTGVVGSGDRTRADVEAAQGTADAATESAKSALDAVAEVRADADAHGEQIDAVKQDIAAYKASAQATYATKSEVDEKTGAITKTLAADYTRTADLAATEAVKDAKKAGTDAQGQLADYMESNDAAVADAKAAGTGASAALDSYKGVVSETYAEKTELTEAVNQLSSTMTSNYSAFTTYRTSNDTAVSKAQTDATNAQSTIDSYKTSNDQAVADAKAAGTTAQSQLNSYKSSNDQAVAAARKAGTDAQSQLGSYKAATDQRLTELQNVADNAIESWYLKGAPTASNPPASSWTTDALRRQHAGDLYMDTDTGYSYRWSGSAWVQVKDSDVTKALKEIESVKTTYATKSELTATDTELSGKVSDALTTAKSYTDSSVEQEVTARNAAIKAQADSISLDVSRTYTRSETFASYQSDADGRIATANSNASTAKSTAQTAASDAATAKTNASNAVSTANAASSNASKAVSTANAASSSASSAVSTANAAKTSAASAVSTANSANSTAGTAKATATAAQAKADDAWARTLRVEVMSAPADAAGDTSLLTAYAFRGGELLSDQTVAMMGLLAWYVGGKRVATGSTYTCKAGTAAECRLEA
jgi:hypothetical protein